MELKQYKELRRDVLTHFKSVRYDHFIKNNKLMPDLPGVYLIYRFNDGHPYIGESNNVRRRLLEHATVSIPTQYIDRQIRKEGLLLLFLKLKIIHIEEKWKVSMLTS